LLAISKSRIEYRNSRFFHKKYPSRKGIGLRKTPFPLILLSYGFQH
jgi:hypothetical protein